MLRVADAPQPIQGCDKFFLERDVGEVAGDCDLVGCGGGEILEKRLEYLGAVDRAAAHAPRQPPEYPLVQQGPNASGSHGGTVEIRNVGESEDGRVLGLGSARG